MFITGGAFICQGNPGPLSELSKIIPFKKVGRAHVIYGELDPKLESVLSKISETIWKPDNK